MSTTLTKPCPEPLVISLRINVCFRYAHMWLKKYRAKKKMFIDNFNLCPWRPIYGMLSF